MIQNVCVSTFVVARVEETFDVLHAARSKRKVLGV